MIAMAHTDVKQHNMTNLPWHTKIVLALLAFLPLFFVISALGTKLGIWGWEIGLLALTMGAGVILLGITAVAAVVSLIIAVRTGTAPQSGAGNRNRRPAGARRDLHAVFWPPGAMPRTTRFHDIATDTANPPAFSEETLAAREGGRGQSAERLPDPARAA